MQEYFKSAKAILAGLCYTHFMKSRWLFPIISILVAVGTSFLPAVAFASRAKPETVSTSLLGGCPVFPGDNVWNTPIDELPVHPRSAEFVAAIGSDSYMHADFGSGTWDGGPIGIPFNIVTGSAPKYSVSFTWPGESDAGPYPIPANAKIEYGSDHHLLVVDQDACKLYELYNVTPAQNGQGWQAGSGAIFDLQSNALRPATWTSADAAGLPMVPGLVRYDEVASGHIDHALRFTVNNSQSGYTWPARHDAPSSPTSHSPVMGLRFRLKASFDISPFPADVQVILKALKKYGMIVADNGSSWYLSGEPDERWNNDSLHTLHQVPGSSFEVVDESGLQVSADSGQAVFPGVIPRLWLPLIR